MKRSQPMENRKAMKKHQSATRQNLIKLSFIGLTFALTTACADRSMVVMESQVEQENLLNDLDRDGVIEARENCADTLSGATIDNYGCGNMRPINERLNLDVKFSNDSSQIPSRDYEKIQEVAGFLTKHPDSKVTIEGHTSKVGSKDYNQVLSEQRASAVASVLTGEFNIAHNRVSTSGYGFERLKAYGNSAQDHAINRRILAELTGTEQVDDMIWTIYSVDQAE